MTSARFWMLVTMLLVGGAGILWGERVVFGGGYGWDGQVYGSWMKEFHDRIFVEGIPRYYVQRLLPSAIVHYGMRLFGVPLRDENILFAFDVYNLLLLLLSTLVWSLIADDLRIRNPGRWLGFCSLFVNFAVLKNTVYNPVQIDTTAFALGLLLVYVFLIDSSIGLAAIMLLGGFAWPLIPYMGAVLYVWPRERPGGAPSPAPGARGATRLAALVSAATLVLYLFLTTVRFTERMATFSWSVRVDTTLVYVSVAGIVVYLFLALRQAAADDRLVSLRHGLAAIRLPRVGIAVAALVLLDVGARALAGGPEPGWGGPRGFAVYTLLSALTEPLIFLLAHVVYYGPVVILLVLFWGPFCRITGELGIGFRWFVILNVLLSLNPQSRYQIHAFPAFVVVLVWLLDRQGLDYRCLPVWVVLSVVYSKVWYPFNTGPQLYDGTMDSLLRFPLQHYFMNAGPWMSHAMYLVQGAVVLATLALLYALAVRQLFGPWPRPGAGAGEATVVHAASRPVP